MFASTRKSLALKELRQRLNLPAYRDSPQPLLRPGQENPFQPAEFAHGLQEMLSAAAADYPAAFAFTLAAAAHAAKQSQGPLFFGLLASESQERGLVYATGLSRFGIDPASVYRLGAASEKSLLWAAEEAASCKDLGAAVIVLGRREKLYGFTASRRLKLRQEASGVPVFILRQACGDATAATARWRILSAPSQGQMTPASPVPLLGMPRFLVRLERYAGLPPQEWEIELDATHSLRVVTPLSNRPLDARQGDRRAA